MRLDDAVFLLPPPEPDPPDRRVKLSRRAFVGWSVGFFGAGASAGVLSGRACAADGDAAEARSGAGVDPGLLRARELAAAPIEELFAYCTAYLRFANRWPDDPGLVRGVRRLVRHILDTPDLSRRAINAQALLDHFERNPISIDRVDLERLRRISRR